MPRDPVVARWASTLNEAGYAAILLDAGWRYVFATDEMRLLYRDAGGDTVLPVGAHFMSAEAVRFRATRFEGQWADPSFRRAWFLKWGGYVLGTFPGGHAELRSLVDPEFADMVDEVHAEATPSVRAESGQIWRGADFVSTSTLMLRIDDGDGAFAGLCMLLKPAAGMSYLMMATAAADLLHLERMRFVEHAQRRSAAILMADLESSSPLARRLPTSEYFAFGRSWLRVADQCLIDLGGIVGRHAGDGVVGLFLADICGSESAAAAACISAATDLQRALHDVALTVDNGSTAELSFRFGLHWGSTLYVGRIMTSGRSEVTALGDEMNEAARIEACATGGRTLASKALVERLDTSDAEALGLDPRHITYTPLAELDSASDKTRRDAPSLAVCEL